MFKRLCLILVLLLVIAIVGCSPPVDTGDNGDDNGDEVAIKDELIFSTTADAGTMDPQDLNSNTEEQIIRMVYNNLLTFDENMNIVGDLAEKWEVAEDGVTWTFWLKEGVTFCDGTPLNAEAVAKSFERITNKDNNLRRYILYYMVVDTNVVDEYTVQLVTEEPFGAFPASLAHTAGGIVNPTYVEKHGSDYGKFTETISGTGPYKVVSWDKDKELIIEAKEDYWGKPGVTKRIIYRPIVENASRVIALETGEVDAISHIPSVDLERLENNPDITVHKVTSNGQRLFRFNVTQKPLDNTLVRRAINHAVDREVIVNSLFKGQAVPATSAVAKAVWGYNDLGVVPFDPELSKQLLVEAGYPNGFDIDIYTTARYQSGVELGEILAAMLQDVGINAQVKVLEWNDIRSYWQGVAPEDNPQQIFIMGAAPSTGDSDWNLRPNYRTHETNVQNYGYYSNEEFDDVIMKAMLETDPVKRLQLYKRAQEIIYLEDPAGIWLFDNIYVIATRSNVKDITMSPLSLVMFEKAYAEK